MESRENQQRPSLPKVWPDALTVQENQGEPLRMLSAESLASSKKVIGQLCSITEECVHELRAALERDEALQVRLVVVVYPATPTRVDDLFALCDLSDAFGERCRLRLSALLRRDLSCTNALLCCGADGSQVFYSGPAANFESGEPLPYALSIGASAEMGVGERVRRWFDWRWEMSIELTRERADIPPLVPAEGTAEAAAMWAAYLASLEQTKKKVKIDEKTGEVEPEGDDGKKGSAEIGIERTGTEAERLAELFAAGQLITIDKASRIPPLDAPVKAEWFGMQMLRHVGAVSRKVEFRISVIDERMLRDIDNKRRKTTDLIKLLTFALADGARWMPNAAVPLFEREQTRINQEGCAKLQSIVGNDVDSFVRGKRADVLKDANAMYHEFYPDRSLPEQVVDEILADLTTRIEKGLSGKFLPSVSFTPVHFTTAARTEWASQWAQAFRFLTELAKYPRKAMNDRYFLQGWKLEAGEVMQAMNVCDDVICRDLWAAGIRERANDECGLIDYIVESPAEYPARCRSLLAVMAGEPAEEVVADLDRARSE